MRKPAPVENDVIDLVRERWSPYAFDHEKPVESAKLLSVLEAARWAASSSNAQPWAFIVGDKDRAPETWQKIFDTLVPFNQSWAKNVPVLILSVSRVKSEKDGSEMPTALYDTGMSVSHLVLQAGALGLHVHQMGGYDREKAREQFSIPDTHVPIAVIAIGYEAPVEILEEEKLRGRHSSLERVRKPLKEFIFSGAGAFGEPSPLVESPK